MFCDQLPCPRGERERPALAAWETDLRNEARVPGHQDDPAGHRGRAEKARRAVEWAVGSVVVPPKTSMCAECAIPSRAASQKRWHCAVAFLRRRPRRAAAETCVASTRMQCRRAAAAPTGPRRSALCTEAGSARSRAARDAIRSPNCSSFSNLCYVIRNSNHSLIGIDCDGVKKKLGVRYPRLPRKLARRASCATPRRSAPCRSPRRTTRRS